MSEWKETHRAMVFPWNCDNYGHMNVRFYFDHFDNASFQAWAAVGCPHEFLREFGVESVSARYTVNYVNELAAGELLVITTAVTRVGNKSVAFGHRMHNVGTGELCATMEAVEVIFDTTTRTSAPMPEPIRDRLNSLILDTDEVAGPRGDAAPNPDAPNHWHEVHRGLVFPWRCDHYGHMNARWYAHHFDDGGFHLFAMAGVDVAALLAQNTALVTAQTQINYIKELNPGELFAIRSGFVHVGNKSARHQHRLYNIKNDELCATMEAIDVVFDMETRRAVVIPDDLRSSLSANLVDPAR